MYNYHNSKKHEQKAVLLDYKGQISFPMTHFYKKALAPNSGPKKHHLRANCFYKELMQPHPILHPNHITAYVCFTDWGYDQQGKEIMVPEAEDHVTLEVWNENGDMEWKGGEVWEESKRTGSRWEHKILNENLPVIHFL